MTGNQSTHTNREIAKKRQALFLTVTIPPKSLLSIETKCP